MCSKLIGVTEHVQLKTFPIVRVLRIHSFDGMQDNGINPFYPEATADEPQPVPEEIQKHPVSASENDRVLIKMVMTSLFLYQITIMVHRCK